MNFRSLFPRLSLFLVGLVLTMVGLHMGLLPETALGLPPEKIAQIVLGDPVATTHMRVAFGGFHVGLGLYSILCAVRRDLVQQGLTAAVGILVCVVAFRVLGIVLDAATPENFISLGREGGVFTLAVAGRVTLWLLPASSASSAEGDSKVVKVLSQLPRFALAVIFILAGVTGWIGLVTGVDPLSPPMTGAMHGFVDPLTAFTPFWMILKTTQLAGGLALLFRRAAPLAVLVLAPIVAVIVMSQALLNAPPGIGIGALMSGLEGWCIWTYRDQYRG